MISGKDSSYKGFVTPSLTGGDRRTIGGETLSDVATLLWGAYLLRTCLKHVVEYRD
jgi:hypothetical protein